LAGDCHAIENYPRKLWTSLWRAGLALGFALQTPEARRDCIKNVQIKQTPEIHVKIQSQYGFPGGKIFCEAAEQALDGVFASLCKTRGSRHPGMAEIRRFRP
jgi:hypothetical protein